MRLLTRDMLEECRLLRRLTSEAGACFIVNDHVDIAMLVQADGVHEPRAGQGPGAFHMAQQGLGAGKIVQTHQMHGLALTMQIFNEGLALQQVAKSRQVDDQCGA